MKIGIIQASSQKDKNRALEEGLKSAVADQGFEVINFGIFENDSRTFSYIQIALCISLLLESNAVDFIVTGCSSGQGMMLACNSLPGVLCGYVQNVTDAYLFGRINDGNAVSYPLGTGFGWAAEINFTATAKALFQEPMGIGYPPEDAKRKKMDTALLKSINLAGKKTITEILPLLDQNLLKKTLRYEVVYDYLMEHGTNNELKIVLQELQ